MINSDGYPLTPINPIGFRQAMLIDADTNHHYLLPAAPASDGMTLVSAGGAWRIGVAPMPGNALKIVATQPLAAISNAAGELVLSITPSWLTPNAANDLFAPLGHTHDWAAIAAKPDTYPPAAHTQDITTITGLAAALDAKAALAHTQDWSTLTGQPAAYPPLPHTQDWATITNAPATFPPAAHTQDIASVTGLRTELDARAALAHTQDWNTITGTPTVFPPAAHTQDWSTITNAPLAYPPLAHTQEMASIVGLAPALDGKAAAQHGHDASEVRSGVLATERIPLLNASHVATGVLAPERLPGLDATQTVSGLFAAERIPGLDAAKIATGVLEPARIPPLDAARIATGVLAPERIPALSYELPLGNPAADGLVLASGTNGARRWIAPVTASGTADRLAKFTGGGALGDSALRERAGMVGVGMEPVSALSVRGDLGTSPGTLYANGPLQVSKFATIGGALSVGGPVQADRSGESAFRGAYAAADGTRGATADVPVRNAAGTGTITLHFKNGLFTGATEP